MAIRPDNSNCIISLFLNFGRVDFGIKLLLFNKIGPRELINTSGTLAQLPQLEGPDFLLFAISLNNNFPLSGVIVGVNLLQRLFDFFQDVVADLVIEFLDVVFIRKDKSQGNTQVGILGHL